MGFHEVQFPVDQAYKSAFGAGWKTGIVELDSGSEERVSRWDSPRHQGDLAHSVRTIANLNTIKDFYMARQGAAYGFRLKDWTDFSTASDHRSAPAFDDVSIGTGDGAQTTFQMVKKYTSGPTTRTRTLKKLVDGTVVSGIDGVEKTITTHFTVNVNDGTITYGTAPLAGEDVTAGCEFDVPVRFHESVDEVLLLDYENYEQGNYSIPVIEVIDEEPQPDEFLFGGFKQFDYEVDIRVTVGDGRVIHLNPSTAVSKVILPHAPFLAGGGLYFFLEHIGASVDTELYESASTVDAAPTDLSVTMTTASNTKLLAFVTKNASQVNTWSFFS